MEEIQRKIKEERQEVASLLREKKLGSLYRTLLRQRGQNFKNKMKRFDASVAYSPALSKKELKLVEQRRQLASGGLSTLFVRNIIGAST